MTDFPEGPTPLPFPLYKKSPGIKHVKGDLVRMALDGEFDVIAHGCNCRCVQKAGIAKQISEEFPGAYEADLETRNIPAAEKLGTLSWESVGTAEEATQESVVVVNLYTQLDPGPYFSLAAFRQALKRLHDMTDPPDSIGLPHIGAGIGGGHWPDILRVIEEELGDRDVTIVEYEKKAP